MWLAIDVGGTKLAAALVSPDGGLARVVRGTTAGAVDAEDLMDRLLAVAREAAGDDPILGLGVGCGGPMRWPDGVVSPLNIPVWRDFPLRDRLRQAWPEIPIRLHNDAVAMAAGEHWRGAGRGTRAMIGVVVSTGVGGGLVIVDRDGRATLLAGPTGNAGHVGHVVVDVDGPPCGCGGRGCLEAIARGPRTVEWAVEQGWQAADDADGPALVAAARDGDPIALAALTRAGRALGVALATTAHLLDLDSAVIGGGFAIGAGDLLLDPARAAFARHAVMDYATRCRIVPSAFGHDAGLVGAAALVATDTYWSGADPATA